MEINQNTAIVDLLKVALLGGVIAFGMYQLFTAVLSCIAYKNRLQNNPQITQIMQIKASKIRIIYVICG
ncbi:MAG: hypothetical protein HUU50_20140 [Candidatus Brocadiae bacterium]|nr:hypothetical protein [Candidatus Brocadiia bacterium]